MSCEMDARAFASEGKCSIWRTARRSLIWWLSAFLVTAVPPRLAIAQNEGLVLERDGRFISLVPYAPNILRVTMSISKAAATAAPGYGIVANPSSAGMDPRE